MLKDVPSSSYALIEVDIHKEIVNRNRAIQERSLAGFEMTDFESDK